MEDPADRRAGGADETAGAILLRLQYGGRELLAETRGDGWRRWISRMRTQGRAVRVFVQLPGKAVPGAQSVGEIEAPRLSLFYMR